MVFFVGTFALQDHIAGDSVFNHEPELRLVEHVLLRSEVDKKELWEETTFILVFWNWRYTKALWNESERQALTFEISLH